MLIYGPPITGKTTGARTFPNPIHVDFDNNTPPGTPNVIKMWSDSFIDSIVPRMGAKYPHRCEALLKILGDLAASCRPDQTVILDSLSRLEMWYNIMEETMQKPISKKTGEVDKFELFRMRFAYFSKCITLFSSCAANVVFICHQQQEKNDDGAPIAQFKPHLIGQSADKLPGLFQTVLQAVRMPRKGSPTGEIDFLWRVRSGNWEPARTPRPANVDFIPQQYSELVKFL